MADAPRIFGEYMRLHRDEWRREGVRLLYSHGWWSWNVTMMGTEESGCTLVQAEAEQDIERAITRIREAAQKLGT